MPIAVQCSGCRGKFRAPDEAAGKRVKCPKCPAIIEVNDAQRQIADPVTPAVRGPSGPPSLPGVSDAVDSRAEMPKEECREGSDDPLRFLDEGAPSAVSARTSAAISGKTENWSRKLLWTWVARGAVGLPVVVGLAWFLTSGTRGGLSAKDGKLNFGEKGISVIVGVDRSDPSRCLISGAMRIEDGKMVAGNTEPGAVVVVGVEEGWRWENQRFEYRHILLRNSERNLMLAPPGVILKIQEPEEVLGFKFVPGQFVVPSDSKIPMPNRRSATDAEEKGAPATTRGKTAGDSSVTLVVPKERYDAIKSLPRGFVYVTSAKSPIASLGGLANGEYLFCFDVFDDTVCSMCANALGLSKIQFGFRACTAADFTSNEKLRLLITDESCAPTLIRRGGARVHFQPESN